MKRSILVAAAVGLAGVEAVNIHHRHTHPKLAKKEVASHGTGAAMKEDCTCTTIIETICGQPTLVGLSPVEPETTIVQEVVVVPTAAIETCSTPGTYTFPATTITLTETTTVCGASSASVSPGAHTLGGVTTVVEAATTVVCPYATTSVDDSGVVTSLIEITTYVCPSAGTYTIAPVVVDVIEETVVVIPIVETYTPGTYIRPQVVTTVTETSVVIVCPYTASPVAVTESTSALELETIETPATSPVSEIVTVETPDEVEVIDTPAIDTPATSLVVEEDIDEPQTSSLTTSSTASSTSSLTTSSATSSTSIIPVPIPSSPSTPGSSNLGSSNDHWAMTYTPYTDDSLCRSQSQIDQDIAAIAAAGFTAVRVYSTDCDTLPYIGGACANNGLKIILGIFVNGGGCTNSNPTVPEQINAIAAWAQWDMVETIVVGNEAIFNGHCTASQIAGLVNDCKNTFNGYSGPYTTAETLNIWELDSTTDALCDVLDVVGANVHPYFNAGVTAATAGTFVAGQLSIIDTICPGKPGINLECGWPSAGNCIGSACPGLENQAIAIADIRAKAGGRTCFFSFTNDLWKQPGSCGCEQSWGSGPLFS